MADDPKALSLTREQLIENVKKAKVTWAPLSVPELGGQIFVRGMSGKERDKFDATFRASGGGNASGQMSLLNFRARYVARVVVDEQGRRLLNDSPEDLALVADLGFATLDRIMEKSTEQSGMTQKAVDALGNDSASQEASGATS